MAAVFPRFELCSRGLAHPCRDIALAMKDAPDINVIAAFDIEDQVRVLLQRPESQIRQVEFMGVPRRSRAGMPADVAVRALQSINEAKRSVWGILAEVVVDCFLGILPGSFARDDPLWSSPTGAGLAHFDFATQAIEVSVINWFGWCGCCAFQQELSQLQAISLFTYELADIFAAGAVAALLDLLVDEVLERVRQGDVHRGHAGIIKAVGKFWQTRPAALERTGAGANATKTHPRRRLRFADRRMRRR